MYDSRIILVKVVYRNFILFGTDQRDVTVAVTAKKLSVQIKGVSLAELALYAAVRPDEMTWTLDAAKAQLAVMVEKADAVSWPRLEAATDGQIL